MVDWLEQLSPGAPDVAACYRALEQGRPVALRREVRRRAGGGSAERVCAQLDVVTDALISVVAALPGSALELPGGEADWNVAEAVGHDAQARSGLMLAAVLAAGGRFPADAPTVVPGVPGPPDATREQLVERLERTRRMIARASSVVAGHETDPCPLDHPAVGRLRCGEWLLFAGVHDCMHLEQLHAIAVAVAR